MRKLKLGIDADDFAFDFVGGFKEFCNNYYGHHFTREQVTTYNLAEILNMGVEEARALIDAYYYHPSFMEMQPIAGAVVAMKELKENDGHEPYVLTSRPEKMTRDVTRRQFEVYFPGIFKDVFFSYNVHAFRGDLTKRAIADREDFEVIGDDNIAYIVNCAAPGRLCCLYSHEDTRWNHKPIENEAEQGIFRFSKFDDFVKRVREFASA